jgi:hypothetical protein
MLVITKVLGYFAYLTFPQTSSKTLLHLSQRTLTKGDGLCTVDLLVQTTLDQLQFTLKILLSFVAKQAASMSTEPSPAARLPCLYQANLT